MGYNRIKDSDFIERVGQPTLSSCECEKQGGENMDKKKIEEIVAEQVGKVIAEGNLSLVDVEFVKEREWYLRIFIDKPGGIDLEDCQFVSHGISDWLDEIDPISAAYHLEVSSPGLDRPLKKEADLERNIGNIIVATFFGPWEGKKNWIGSLDRFDKETLFMKIDEEVFELPRRQIAQIRLHLE